MTPKTGPFSMYLEMLSKDHLGYVLKDLDGNEVAICLIRGNRDQVEANARMLKSAPDMLEILAELRAGKASDLAVIDIRKIDRILNFVLGSENNP